jgi:hypothetical protein
MTTTVSEYTAQQQSRACAANGKQGDVDAWLGHALEEAIRKSVVVGTPLSLQHDFDAQLAAASILTADLRASVDARLGFTVSAGAGRRALAC